MRQNALFTRDADESRNESRDRGYHGQMVKGRYKQAF